MVNTIMSTMKKINKEKGEHMRKTILIMTLLLAVSLTGCGTTQNKNSETTVAKSMTENDYNKAVEKLTDKSAYQTIVEDFDSDNNKEAFVLTREGKDNEAVEDEFELWFSNGDKTEKIVSDFIADNNTSITLFESGKDKYVLFNKAQTTQNDEMEAKIYGVSSEKPVELFSQSRMNIFVEKGELYTWGYSMLGQTGNGKTDVLQKEPVKILDDVWDVSLGRWNAAAVTNSGDLYVWGSNKYGQIGNNATDANAWNVPAKIMENIKSVSVGDYRVGAVTINGDFYLWGRNDDGRIQKNSTENCYSPQQMKSGVLTCMIIDEDTIIVFQDGETN